MEKLKKEIIGISVEKELISLTASASAEVSKFLKKTYEAEELPSKIERVIQEAELLFNQITEENENKVLERERKNFDLPNLEKLVLILTKLKKSLSNMNLSLQKIQDLDNSLLINKKIESEVGKALKTLDNLKYPIIPKGLD